MNTPQSTEPEATENREPKWGVSPGRLLRLALFLLYYAYTERRTFTGPMDAVVTFLLPFAGGVLGLFMIWRLRLREVVSFRGWGWAALAVGVVMGAAQATHYVLETSGVRDSLSSAMTMAVLISLAIPVVVMIDEARRK